MKKNKLYLLGFVFAVIFCGCEEESIAEHSFGTLTGTVVSKGKNIPLSNVKISTTPVSTTLFTDIDGNFQIEDIAIGKYSVQAEIEEFQTTFKAATIMEAKTVHIVFELDSLDAGNLSPLAPKLLFPADKSQEVPVKTAFTWSSSKNDKDNIDYTLELRNGATNQVSVYEALKDTVLTIEHLAIGVNYFWQVTADDGVNSPVKSALSSFTTKETTNNRFFYVRDIDGNNVIFSGAEPTGNGSFNQNELQLTNTNNNSYRPVKNNTVGKIAFLRTVGTQAHLFAMNPDGSGVKQITAAVSVAGFRQDELEFSWYDNGAKLYYPNFNKLYSINLNGSGNKLVYEVVNGSFISEVAVNAVNNLIAIKTNDANGYNARIVVVDIATGTEQNVVVEGQPGALGGLDFSVDGTKILFTRDVSGVENAEYRQLDARIFEYSLANGNVVEITTKKTAGTNNLDPKYSPDEGTIIFTNTSNDGLSEKKIFRTNASESNSSQLLFTNAFMPNWE
ncbi:Carboxypeptidase regulatory-like domain-containing protein [Arenibacter nanhaiticus]|uniref:Carboxypeptidase regulatory-like domain-containing protein n=1 Tax=Arenibacter nanhaiticus TaxID=558155 RepID=A0A1M6KPE4_9FLAO|nr:carboxypeptidase regulatory-like domain-containing protein [Arenibacter nanhaiticus]SHJ60781.1 Carboxypeptidase regulatory-like domain-containing protein [Arenibacter nanhaiticus]